MSPIFFFPRPWRTATLPLRSSPLQMNKQTYLIKSRADEHVNVGSGEGAHRCLVSVAADAPLLPEVSAVVSRLRARKKGWAPLPVAFAKTQELNINHMMCSEDYMWLNEFVSGNMPAEMSTCTRKNAPSDSVCLSLLIKLIM